MKRLRINILIDFYTDKLSDIANRVSVLAATAQEDEKPNFHKIVNEAKSLFADYIVFKAKARKFIELLGMPYGQMWANEYELRTAKYFDFLLN